MVSPIPSCKSTAIAALEATIPLLPIPASVKPNYGYRQIRTPVLEQTGLFLRGIGEVTDIVEKEMYSFTDALNGEQLSLRPESTAGVVRAVIEHHLLREGPQRL
ncbi:MAG: hypothetical protein EBX57_12655, partial [Betaproteobacteria bacterium]|nr:hypothetical protein [Betaproteobacteria bacterium]